MTHRLGGWQRLGVVISVCWLVGSFVGFRAHQYQQGMDSANAAVRLCSAYPAQKTFDQCWDENLPYRQSALAPYWPPILFVSLAPIPLFWFFGWTVIAVVRWVRAGFVNDKQ